jgi:beta-mannosidase
MKKLPYLFFLFLISCFRTETPLETIILLNDGWEFKKLEADDADWRPANVPGTVHTDLLLNGEIEDPFYACNEKELQWIGTNDWIYRKSFYIDDEILINQHITLRGALNMTGRPKQCILLQFPLRKLLFVRPVQ